MIALLIILALQFQNAFGQRRITDWDSLYAYGKFAQHANAAYCNNIVKHKTWDCPDDYCMNRLFNSTIIETFGQNDGKVGTGFITINHPERLIVTAFRGTDNFAKFITDITMSRRTPRWINRAVTHPKLGQLQSANAIKLPEHFTLHHGMSDAYGKIRDVVQSTVYDLATQYPEYVIAFTGHSLGGSHAAMAAFDFMNHYGKKYNNRVKVYTFAQPRTGNGGWAQTYVENVNFTRRFTKYGDPGPQTPSKADKFYHHTTEIFIDQSNNIHRCEAAEFGESSGKACINRKFFPILWNHQMKYYSLDNADKC